jgi:immune inhibitor A
VRKVLAGLASLALATSAAATTAAASPSTPSGARRSASAAAPPTDAAAAPNRPTDELPNGLEAKRRELRDTAVEQVLKGEATPTDRGGSQVVQVGNAPASDTGAALSPTGAGGQYVELAREQTDRVFVVLAEFGDERHPNYPDQDTDPDTPGPVVFDGPLHNQIPEPDRRVDNSTVWQADYDREHFQDVYFAQDQDSVKTYFETQSSGRYSVDGTVTDWVKVPYNEARYGRSGGYPCADNVCANVYNLVEDGVNAWYEAEKVKGRSDADIGAELATFDQWDRYDFDFDGDFNEPDGYIDHFQIVHAGGDEADGDPYQGEDAIWSHRAYAFGTPDGTTGPPTNRLGGTEIGDTGFWVGDYTMQPENGGLSVFVHEYAHDLGLPDDYDFGGDNSQEYWTLMAQSRLNAAGEPLGTKPGDLGAWNKLQLGWLDYEIVNAGQERTLDLGPSEYNTNRAQALVVTLPDKEVTEEYGTPYAGEHMLWSDRGDGLSTTYEYGPFDLSSFGSHPISLDMKTRFAIEAEYDYLYVQASSDGGATWTSLDGTVDGEPFDRDANGAPGLSHSTEGQWVDLSVPLDAWRTPNVSLRFLYATDGGVAEDGFFADDVTLDIGGWRVTDGFEAGGGGTADGFRITTGTESGEYPNYYVAAKRSYVSYDQYLKTGPYNFGFPDRPDWVEHYAYQPGLLITYADGSQVDNAVSEHPGTGRNLNIDSRPRPIANLCGGLWRTRIQVYDAPFTKKKADSMTLHCNGRASYVRGQAGQPVFDDRETWWFAEKPDQGVKVPVNGVRIEVLAENANRTTVKVSSTA